MNNANDCVSHTGWRRGSANSGCDDCNDNIQRGTIMLIMTDNMGVTVKSTVQSENYVRIGVLLTSLWIGGVRRFDRRVTKPHCEYDLNDCADLLDELEHVEKLCF